MFNHSPASFPRGAGGGCTRGGNPSVGHPSTLQVSLPTDTWGHRECTECAWRRECWSCGAQERACLCSRGKKTRWAMLQLHNDMILHHLVTTTNPGPKENLDISCHVFWLESVEVKTLPLTLTSCNAIKQYKPIVKRHTMRIHKLPKYVTLWTNKHLYALWIFLQKVKTKG